MNAVLWLATLLINCSVEDSEQIGSVCFGSKISVASLPFRIAFEEDLNKVLSD